MNLDNQFKVKRTMLFIIILMQAITLAVAISTAGNQCPTP